MKLVLRDNYKCYGNGEVLGKNNSKCYNQNDNCRYTCSDGQKGLSFNEVSVSKI